MYGSFICGLPGESKLSVMKTMIKLHTRKIPLDHVIYIPLGIFRKTAHRVWDSAFNLDFEKYGYIDRNPQSKIPFVDWQNEHMTLDEAIEMTRNFNSKYVANHTDYDFKVTLKIVDEYKMQLRKHLDNVQP